MSFTISNVSALDTSRRPPRRNAPPAPRHGSLKIARRRSPARLERSSTARRRRRLARARASFAFPRSSLVSLVTVPASPPTAPPHDRIPLTRSSSTFRSLVTDPRVTARRRRRVPSSSCARECIRIVSSSPRRSRVRPRVRLASRPSGDDERDDTRRRWFALAFAFARLASSRPRAVDARRDVSSRTIHESRPTVSDSFPRDATRSVVGLDRGVRVRHIGDARHARERDRAATTATERASGKKSRARDARRADPRGVLLRTRSIDGSTAHPIAGDFGRERR